ncbi:hypothetical protein E2C01_046533 [Portunus trituberculatus]|uniref:Uncharacterized protein n=1 Tax=Portunus trituberculatus TaxID=210409 RepID=A0A5B7G544_PORTR|nr:hypothetical protein [Portunus trituberculatus]
MVPEGQTHCNLQLFTQPMIVAPPPGPAHTNPDEEEEEEEEEGPKEEKEVKRKKFYIGSSCLCRLPLHMGHRGIARVHFRVHFRVQKLQSLRKIRRFNILHAYERTRIPHSTTAIGEVLCACLLYLYIFHHTSINKSPQTHQQV